MKTIKLSVGQAKELYNTNNEFRSTILHEFTDEELGIEPVLKDWEGLDFKDTYYVSFNGEINKEKESNRSYGFKNVPTKKHAKSMIAFAKLSMLMADLKNECDVDWRSLYKKYVIVSIENRIEKTSVWSSSFFLAFKTESIRDKFLEKHKELIKDYFMID